jgi:hypothetical protein
MQSAKRKIEKSSASDYYKRVEVKRSLSSLFAKQIGMGTKSSAFGGGSFSCGKVYQKRSEA